MSICFTVELLNGTFRGRAGDQAKTAWPPSPARLVGALLSGAHSLDGADESAPSGLCASARRALEAIVSAPPPTIVTPEEPAELAGNTTWYAPRVWVAPRLGEKPRVNLPQAVDTPAITSSYNREPKSRTVSILPTGSVLRYYVDVDIADDREWHALSAAAGAVPFFGTSSDHALITVERVEAEPEFSLGEHIWGPLPAGSKRAGRTIRTWRPETISWFDDVHRRGGESVADWRIRTTTYAHVAPVSRTAACADFHMLTLNSPITLREFAERVSSEPGWIDAEIFPAVEFNAPDRVRGFGLYGPGTADALTAAPDDLAAGADFPGSFVSWERSTWFGPSKSWQSATPVAAHRDLRVARVEINHHLSRYGLILKEMSARPFTRWHSKHLSVPSNYSLWFITAECEDPQADPITGPVRIGECLSSGAGLMTPRRS